MEQEETRREKKKKKRLNFNKEDLNSRLLNFWKVIKPSLKNPKVWIVVFLLWYVETPIIIMAHKGFLNVSLISLYINPFKIFIEFITSIGVIWGFLKFNLILVFIFILVCLVMHLFGMETGKIVDFEKLKLLYSSMAPKEGEIKFSNRGDFGTARWATKASIEKANRESVASHSDEYVKITKDGSDGLIYGYFGDVEVPKKGSTPIMTLPKKTTLNRNFAVFGSSGSMKSRSFVIPNILNLIKNGESFFATDPKGELLSKTSKVLKDSGYNVKAFNINNIPCSDRWNVLKEIKDAKSAAIFAKAIVENTRSGDAGDEFWENHYINFLKALALYVVNNEPEERQNMKTVYEYITYPEGFAGLDELIGRALNDNPLHPAYQSWIAFKTAAGNEKVSSGVMSGLAIKLDTLQIPQFCDLLSGNDIDLTAPGKERCAYFIVVPDTHTTFNFLAGLFFTFAFIDLLDFADKLNGPLPIQVNFLLDEFPNIAKIPDIEKKISTVRSRGVNICIIFQNYTQLCSRYSENIAEELLGNCDSKIFLGANEMTTSKYISNMLGDATIEVETVSQETFSMFANKKSTGLAKRNLKTPDEVYNKPKKNSYVKIIGLQPILCTKMDYTMHEMGSLVKETPIFEMLKDWAKDYHEEYLESIIEQLNKAIVVSSEVQGMTDEEAENYKKIKVVEELSEVESENRSKKRVKKDIKKELEVFNANSIKNVDNIKAKQKLEKTLREVEAMLEKIRKEKAEELNKTTAAISKLNEIIPNVKTLNDLQEYDEEITKIINDKTTTDEQLASLMELKTLITTKKEEIIKKNKDKINNKFKQLVGNIQSILDNPDITTEELEKARVRINECREFADKENLPEVQREKITELENLRDKLSEEAYNKSLKEEKDERLDFSSEEVQAEVQEEVEVNDLSENIQEEVSTEDEILPQDNNAPLISDIPSIEEIQEKELNELEGEEGEMENHEDKKEYSKNTNSSKTDNNKPKSLNSIKETKKTIGNTEKNCENSTKMLYNYIDKDNKSLKKGEETLKKGNKSLNTNKSDSKNEYKKSSTSNIDFDI
ncbi:VirD4-like conjugal transfer protein, CD1115 family (plasmid) [Clostridium perfringens]